MKQPVKGEIVEEKNIVELGHKLRAEGQKIVFTAGSFDLLHIGHLRYLQKAKTYGQVLVVGIPSNKSLRKLKGRGRPIIDERARAEALLYTEPVDFVVIFTETTIFKTLKNLKPDVFFTVDEAWNKGLKESPEYLAVVKYGGRVVLSARQSPFISASAIINRIAGAKVKEVFRECLAAADKSGVFSEDIEKVQLKFEI